MYLGMFEIVILNSPGANLYISHHHEYEPVVGVRAVGDIVVTGGINGNMAVIR